LGVKVKDGSAYKHQKWLKSPLKYGIKAYKKAEHKPEPPKRMVPIAEPPTYECPHGFELNQEKHICERLDHRKAVKGCPRFYRYDKTLHKCIREQEFEPDYLCPEGYKVYGSKCKAVDVRHPTHRCDPGFTYENKGKGAGQCVKYVTTKPDHQCDHGYHLVDHKCQKEIAEQPQFTCDKGYHLKGEKCIKHVSVAGDFHCPDGFKLVGSTCHRKTMRKAVKTCTDGFTLRGGDKCVRSAHAMATPLCPDNYELVGKECVHEKETEGELACPPGTHFDKDGTTCVREDRKPPTPTTTTSGKKGGYEDAHPHGGDGKAFHLSAQSADEDDSSDDAKRRLGPSGHHGKHHESKGIVEDPLPVDEVPTYMCEPGWQLVDPGHDAPYCSMKVEVDPITKCPDGRKGGHGKCVHRTVVKPDYSCGTGYNQVDGKCKATAEQEPKLVCEHHFVLNVDTHQCEKHEEEPAGQICPHGYETHADGHCAKVLKKRASASCAHPYKLHEDHHTHERTCVMLDKVPPAPKCPHDFHPDGKICRGKITGEPVEKCEEGYERDGEGQCVSKHMKEPHPICKKGELKYDAVCVIVDYKKPGLACDVGYKLDGNRCSKPEYTKPYAICNEAEGFEYDAVVKQCIKWVEKAAQPADQEEVLSDIMGPPADSPAPVIAPIPAAIPPPVLRLPNVSNFKPYTHPKHATGYGLANKYAAHHGITTGGVNGNGNGGMAAMGAVPGGFRRLRERVERNRMGRHIERL